MKSLMFLSAALAAITLPLPAAAQSASDRFSVEVIGQGPDVILIPGLSSPRSVWDETVSALSDDYRLHLVEVAGFGETPAGVNTQGDILPHLVGELAAYAATLEAPTIVGHSMGGFAGLHVALDHPDKVGKLVIVDSLPFFSVLLDPQASVESVTPQAEQMRTMMLGALDVEWPAPDCAAPSAQAKAMSNDPEGQCRIDRYTFEADRAVTAQLMYEIMTTDLRRRLGELEVATVMFYPFDPPAIRAEMAHATYGTAYGEVDTVTLVPVEGARHFLMFDQPETFHDRLAAFLAN